MPVQVKGEVLSVKPMGDYFAMTVVASGIAEHAKPGQFVAVAVGGEDGGMLLRRAFSIYSVRETGVYGGTVEFIFSVTGRGTAWLSRQRPYDPLDVVGPLGRPFALPREPANCVLVGGGYGSAPLFMLGDALRTRGCRTDFVLGASTGDRLFGALDAKRMAATVAFTTDDGSYGEKGRVSDVLPEVIDRVHADVVYACGPMPMLEAVQRVAGAAYEGAGIPTQLSVEESMACGVGVCMTCVLPVIGADDKTRMVRSCVDGPVFAGDRIRWDALGTVPDDAIGVATDKAAGAAPMSITLRRDVGTTRHVAVDMTTTLGSLTVADPIFTASGCAAAGQELAAFNDLGAIGGVVTKSIQLLARAGRATPRMAETPSGMLNSIGLQGPGIDVFIKRDLGWLEEHGVTAVVSIAGSSVDDYQKLANKLRGKPLAMIEVNISCPNVDDRGQVFACDRSAAASVVSAVRRAAPSGVPVFAKLSPDVTDIVSIAKACVDAGATGLSLINTTLGMVIDTDTMRPALAGVTGGLSGPAIRPLALRCVWQVHEALPDVPLFGIGGIRTGLDAFQFILAGASAVQVGTVIFNDPGAPGRISRELREVLAARGMHSLAPAIGLGHRAPDQLIPEDPEPIGAELMPSVSEEDDVSDGEDEDA